MKTFGALFLVALAIRLAAISHWQFDGLYGQDAFAYFDQAVAISTTGTPPLNFFWPDGYPLLSAFSMMIIGRTALAGQLVSVLCGAALAPLACLLARELFPQAHPRAGLIAGLIVAVAGQAILSSIVIMADILALFWATLSAWLLVSAWRRSRSGWWLIGAGLTLAMAIITRWLFVVLVPAFGLYALYQIQRHHRWWRLIALPIISGALIVLPQVLLSLNRPEGLVHSWLLGWNPVNAVRRQFDNVDGHFEYKLSTGVFYTEPAGHPAYLFPLLGLAALWGIYRLWGNRDWGALILLIGWGGAVYLFLAGIPYQNFRFGLTLYTPIVLLAGLGTSDLWDRVRVRWIVPAMTALSLIGMLLWAYPMLNDFLTQQNQTKAIVYQVAQSLPPDATLVTFGLTLTAQHYTHLDVIELFNQTADSLDALTRDRSQTFLLIDVANIDQQWRGREPDVNVRWLHDHTTLIPITSYQSYTLFQVRRP
jgi:4-amino-4-deoxy-L-arabinose transferase-like glycosyltransferase